MKLGGSIFGGIKARREAKKQQKMLDAQKAENQAWYNRRYNEDGTQRADAQRLLTNTQDLLRRQTKAAQGANAVTGASTEAVAKRQAPLPLHLLLARTISSRCIKPITTLWRTSKCKSADRNKTLSRRQCRAWQVRQTA